MDENDFATLRPSRARLWPCLSVVTLVSVLCAGLGVPAYLLGRRAEDARKFLENYRPPSPSEATINQPIQYAMNSDERNDVIFLGDSTCKRGIDTRQYEKLTGVRAYNLGAQGMLGMDGIALIFETYLKHHPAPRLVILAINPTELTHPLSDEWRRVHDRFIWCYGSGSESERPPNNRPVQNYIVRGAFYAFGEATGGWQHYRRMPMPSEGSAGGTYDEAQQRLSEDRGYWHAPDVEPPETPRFYEPLEPLAIWPEYQQALRKLCRMAQEHGILVVVRLSPLPPSATAKDFEPLLGSLAQIAREYSNVTISQPAIIQYPPTHFIDTCHPNSLGRELFMSVLSQETARAFAEKSVKLP